MQFEFRISDVLLKKRILPRDAPERKGPGGVFTNPEKEFVLAQLNGTHTLIFSKHCMYRPHYVLHTKAFAPQTDDLDESDLSAALTVLKAFERPHMVIFNCGVDAGASQGHKHMQLFPYSPDVPFRVFPDNVHDTESKSRGPGKAGWTLTSLIPSEDVTSDIPGVPHRHFVIQLPDAVNVTEIHDRYRKLLNEVKLAHMQYGHGEAYNIIMTINWLCLIPRRNAGKGTTAANAAGMIGLVWLRDQAERDSWADLGFSNHLRYLGMPLVQTRV
jgi:sulfate adenylyltransferase (ADP) / ATP adenylyltransferase